MSSAPSGMLPGWGRGVGVGERVSECVRDGDSGVGRRKAPKRTSVIDSVHLGEGEDHGVGESWKHGGASLIHVSFHIKNHGSPLVPKFRLGSMSGAKFHVRGPIATESTNKSINK